MREVVARFKRGIKKPPRVIAQRLFQELKNQFERYWVPVKIKQFTLNSLLKKTNSYTLHDLWSNISTIPYVAELSKVDFRDLETICPNEYNGIIEKAGCALRHEVNLLGSGAIALGTHINWHQDYKTNSTWPKRYMRDIDYNNLDRPSDVKFPWEVSRLQWLIPAGQAYLLTQDESYAEAVKNILIAWIKENPYSIGINWACTMEVALRILSWTWFFHVFKDSQAWQDPYFQEHFLITLYLHAEFTENHLEFSDINGNHYTADAAGLVFAGLFFGENNVAKKWYQKGWNILCHELPRQVFSDGVDFEASIPYHRLVLELFFLPARYAALQKHVIPNEYKERLISMANFCSSYLAPDALAPLWGDADDARALPFGLQPINNHTYLCNWIGIEYNNLELLIKNKESLGEVFWLFGADACNLVIQKAKNNKRLSRSFPAGGFYIMRNELDHIFIDCGPLGLAGRGGHGHNDCLSFEATLNGVKLISDCGAYLYTASYEERNLFRSTQSHNTPCVDNLEINRFIQWNYLWNMHNDAHPVVERWDMNQELGVDIFCGSHTGYQRLENPVVPKRTIKLHHASHKLEIIDEIITKGIHEITIPLYFSPQTQLSFGSNHFSVLIQKENRDFILTWSSNANWTVSIENARISPSYGLIEHTKKLTWHINVQDYVKLRVMIEPRE